MRASTLQYHWFTPNDPTNDLRGLHAGIRGAIELWYEPDALTMWAADASVTSVGPSYSARVAFGWRLFDAFYLGPEVAGFAGGDTYKQWRAGIHITGFRTGTIEWSLAAGWASNPAGMKDLTADRVDRAEVAAFLYLRLQGERIAPSSCGVGGRTVRGRPPQPSRLSGGGEFRVRKACQDQSSVRLNRVTAIVIAISISTNSATAS